LQAIDVILNNPNLKAVGLAAAFNWRQVLIQAKILGVRKVALWDERAAHEANLNKRTMGLENLEILSGPDGLCHIASLPDADTVLHAIPGFAGIKPLISSLQKRKQVALTGKEALVSAGEIIKPFLVDTPKAIIPVDSEHSAIFQCLEGENKQDIKHIILTASGGAFRDLSQEELEKVGPQDALRHPTWTMGPKVTVDSATLFNKTLEVMEAHYFFDVPYDKIKVAIHRESIVHSLVTFKDGSTKAQLSKPDMRLPIAFALNYPERQKGAVPALDVVLGTLTFREPDLERFPCLGLGYEAGKMGGTAPCVLSFADEVVVREFMQGRVSFTKIYTILKTVLDRYQPKSPDSIEVLEQEAKWAESETRKAIDTIMRR
jgi:1-deoxy-D-xylulose-5-phosphate reductoisomerase